MIISDPVNFYHGEPVRLRNVSYWGAAGEVVVCTVELERSPGLTTQVRGQHLSPTVTRSNYLPGWTLLAWLASREYQSGVFCANTGREG